ncbi:MAG: peptidoglycan editing factor PgeF [Rhodocyclaceae bacterium]|nr:peptidoglycan editing factor PgeF [Rhodocyclaceae bacterium]
MNVPVIQPDWPAPPTVRAVSTTRLGGVSRGAFASLNLGTHVGDEADLVDQNRRRLRALLPAEPMWLEQVHGTDVAAWRETDAPVTADAAFTSAARGVCVVMTADCLPVLLCDRAGTVVAAAHAGWRGLLGGVLENTLRAMQVESAQVLAWLGPAIGPRAFEVGNEVREAFLAADPVHRAAFSGSAQPGKWMADLYRLARQRLEAAGVMSIHGGEACTHGDPERFFSYRRDGVTGRQASLIWLTESVR